MHTRGDRGRERADRGEGVGDPTEIAILVAAAAQGILTSAIEGTRSRVQVKPFDPDRRRMSILRADGILYVKGAVESVLPLCHGDTTPARAMNQQMAARGLRVLAVATGRGAAEADDG